MSTQSDTDEVVHDTAPQGFDLGAAASVADAEDEGQFVHVHDPAGEPLYFTDEAGEKQPVGLTMAGSYSKTYRRAENAQRTRNLKVRATKLTGEMLDRNKMELVAACVLSWQGFFDAGKPIPLSKQNAVLVFDRAPWVLSQAESGMDDHAGFSRASSPS